jgi:hypothetical protein
MSKKIQFTVSITFSEKVTDDQDILDIAKNIARAIKNEAVEGDGITTDFTDAITREIEVKPQFSDETITLKVIY